MFAWKIAAQKAAAKPGVQKARQVWARYQPAGADLWFKSGGWRGRSWRD
jgi:hypothetical protein